MAKLDKKWITEGYKLHVIDDWLWIQIDKTHFERLPYEVYEIEGHTIKIKGSITKYLRDKLKEDGVL